MKEFLHNRKRNRIILLGVTGLFCLTLIGWNHEPVNQQGDTIYYRDTVPSGESQSTRQRDLDRELKKLEEAKSKMEEISGKNWQEISENLQKELKKINTEEIKVQIDLALKDVDMKKINEDIKVALKEIDLEGLQQRISESLADVNVKVDINTDEIRKAIAEAKVDLKKELQEVKKINTEEIKEAMQAAEIDIKKAMAEIKIDKSLFAESMKDAKKGIEKAVEEVKGYQEMIYSMEKDGLLNTREDYNIEYRNGSIFINDKKQSEVVTSKYQKYFPKENMTITKKKGDFTISQSDKED
ncbi:MAG TPA: hypothetical protein VK625_23560 [Flavitalea sp.]|nr:hypothetical protein [Flavitalea sp.]